MARMPHRFRRIGGVAVVLAMVGLPSFGYTPTLAQVITDQAMCSIPDGAPPADELQNTGSQSGDAFVEHFPCIVRGLAADPAVPQGSSPTASDGTAPSPPIRTIDASGNYVPVDLSLQTSGNGFAPASPLVDLGLPGDLGDPIVVGDQRIGINLGATDPSAAEAATARPLAGEGLFYADAAPATDVVLAPITQGLETIYQLRGPESPRHLQMRFALPDDARLQAAVDGGYQIVEDEQPIASLNRPHAVDASGDSVAVNMTAHETSLDLDVARPDSGTTYPIAVTATAASFVSASASANSVTPGIDGVSGQVADETSHAASLGVQVIRQHILWCQLEPDDGVYNRNQLQSIVDRVYYAHSRNNLKTLIEFSTAAPVFARTAAMQGVSPGSACAHDGTGAASIASAKTGRYGTAMWKIALCLNNDPRCNENLTCSPNCSVDTHGEALLDNGAVYGFEAGNEPNTTNFWQNGQDTITRTQADIYWNALSAAAYAVHSYRPSVLVGSAGLSYGTPNNHPWSDHVVDATNYLDQLLSNGQSGADAYSIHPYGPGLHPDIEYVNGIAINVDADAAAGASRQILLSRGYGYLTPIWITEVGVDADYNDDNDVSANQEEGRQFNDLYYTWRNSIREFCSSWNVPLAIFWTFKDQHRYGYVDPNTGEKPDYYAGFAKLVANSNPPPDETVNYSKLAYFLFNASQALPDNTCTG